MIRPIILAQISSRMTVIVSCSPGVSYDTGFFLVSLRYARFCILLSRERLDDLVRFCGFNVKSPTMRGGYFSPGYGVIKCCNMSCVLNLTHHTTTESLKKNLLDVFEIVFLNHNPYEHS